MKTPGAPGLNLKKERENSENVTFLGDLEQARPSLLDDS